MTTVVRKLQSRKKCVLQNVYSSDTASDDDARIAVDPDVHFGKPCVRGTRIPVRDVLEVVQEGYSFDVITTQYYPDLEKADVKACVQYAIDTLDAEEIHVSIPSS